MEDLSEMHVEQHIHRPGIRPLLLSWQQLRRQKTETVIATKAKVILLSPTKKGISTLQMELNRQMTKRHRYYLLSSVI